MATLSTVRRLILPISSIAPRCCPITNVYFDKVDLVEPFNIRDDDVTISNSSGLARRGLEQNLFSVNPLDADTIGVTSRFWNLEIAKPSNLQQPLMCSYRLSQMRPDLADGFRSLVRSVVTSQALNDCILWSATASSKTNQKLAETDGKTVGSKGKNPKSNDKPNLDQLLNIQNFFLAEV